MAIRATPVVVAGPVLAGLCLAAGWALDLARIHQYRGYYAPVFDARGAAVFVLERRTRGVVVGWGYESFSLPAHVWVLSDRFDLVRIALADGATEVLESWPNSPAEGIHQRRYRGRIFGSLFARLESEDVVAYAARLDVRDGNPRRDHLLRGHWPGGRGAWKQDNRTVGGYGKPLLSGDREVITLPGPEGYGAAVVLYRQTDGDLRVLAKSADFDSRYGAGVPPRIPAEQARRATLERHQFLADTRAALIVQFKAAGANEGAAMVRASQEMARRGLIPRRPSLTARSVAADLHGSPKVFDITDMEFKVGLFADIALALDTPGEAVDRGGRYLTHTDYATSAALNNWLAAGNDVFHVRTADGALYEMTITRYPWPPPEAK